MVDRLLLLAGVDKAARVDGRIEVLGLVVHHGELHLDGEGLWLLGARVVAQHELALRQIHRFTAVRVLNLNLALLGRLLKAHGPVGSRLAHRQVCADERRRLLHHGAVWVIWAAVWTLTARFSGLHQWVLGHGSSALLSRCSSLSRIGRPSTRQTRRLINYLL